MRITAAVVEKHGAPFIFEELELAEPGPGEALVRLVASGICHADAIARDGDLPMPLPGVLGHEGSGVIEAIGDGVTQVAVGDHVVIGWPSCGQCRNCLRGEPRYCGRIGEALLGGVRLLGPGAGSSAYQRLDGSEIAGHFFGQSSLATHAITLASALVPIDKSLPLELYGPLACGLTTGAGAVFNTARPEPGASLVIFGVGAVGLAAVMAAVNTPATTIVAVDRHPARLDLARRFGATHTVDASSSDNVLDAVRDACHGPANHALECTGVIPVVQQAAESIGMLGTCILIGGAPAGAGFSLDHLRTLWGKRIVGTLGGSGTSAQLIPALIDLHRAGRFPFHELVRFYPFDRTEQALVDSASGAVVKPIIRMSNPTEGAL